MSSPRVWGCFLLWNGFTSFRFVFPTRVGVFLNTVIISCLLLSLPHACGGVSVWSNYRCNSTWSSPRVWGCFLCFVPQQIVVCVFPTRVGVFLNHLQIYLDRECLPHACGGVSVRCAVTYQSGLSSPRVWGCFSFRAVHGSWKTVFPTRVGVFLSYRYFREKISRLPHACGGVSDILLVSSSGTGSSPRVWGCFLEILSFSEEERVFPTRVGVFLSFIKNDYPIYGLPHACGGVSFCD